MRGMSSGSEFHVAPQDHAPAVGARVLGGAHAGSCGRASGFECGAFHSGDEECSDASQGRGRRVSVRPPVGAGAQGCSPRSSGPSRPDGRRRHRSCSASQCGVGLLRSFAPPLRESGADCAAGEPCGQHHSGLRRARRSRSGFSGDDGASHAVGHRGLEGRKNRRTERKRRLAASTPCPPRVDRRGSELPLSFW